MAGRIHLHGEDRIMKDSIQVIAVNPRAIRMKVDTGLSAAIKRDELLTKMRKRLEDKK